MAPAAVLTIRSNFDFAFFLRQMIQVRIGSRAGIKSFVE